MEHFLSCDWGTSSFRIRLIDINNARILAEENSGQGIAGTHTLWLEKDDPDGERKVSFYLNVIQQHINKIEEKIGSSLSGLKLIVSGMASSTIGFINIPYKPVPLSTDGSGMGTASLTASKDFDHDVLIISGIKTSQDVIRGEETQLIGCIGPNDFIKNELYIFPGTHSKHILVKDNQVVDFKTFMTGEVFELLSQKSILKSAVEFERAQIINPDFSRFITGIKDAISLNILNAAFKVRINQLFNSATGRDNYNYLSGLLIGTELKDLKNVDADAINLICGSNLEKYYRIGLQTIGFSNIKLFPPGWVDEATVRGHVKIGKQLKILA